jgi:parvulin-like peptidyl-prolyl isomerase
MADQAHDPIDDWLGDHFSLLKIGSRRSLIVYALGATLGLALAGFSLFTAKGTSIRTFPPENVALVNGRQILRSDFRTQTQVEAGMPFEQTTAAQRRKVLDEMLDEELLVQRGMEVDLSASDPDVRAALVSGVNLQVDADVLAQQPTREQLLDYYNRHIDKYSSDGVMRVRDLVMPTGDKPDEAVARAQQASAELSNGATVEAVSAKYGLKDSGRIDQEDNFDFAVKAKLGPDIYAGLAKLQPGQATAPVKQPDGVHVVLLTKRVVSVKLDFDKAQDNVWQDYKKEAREKVERANLKYLRGRADIVLAPEFRK